MNLDFTAKIIFVPIFEGRDEFIFLLLHINTPFRGVRFEFSFPGTRDP
jgi:hypothetical protein